MGKMMRTVLLFLLPSLSWSADNVCTFSKPSGATACNGSNVCTTSGIAADSTRAYWSCTVSGGGNGYVPAAPDSIVGPTGYTITWDDRNFDLGASGNPYYSYPAYVVVDSAGSGYTAPPTITLSCTGSCAYVSRTPTITFWVDMNGAGGVAAIRFRSLIEPWFTAASAAPTIALSAGGGTTATAHIVMQPGGGTPAVLGHGTFQVKIGSAKSAILRGDALEGTDGSGTTGLIVLMGSNALTFDSTGATPLSDGVTNYYPIYSIGGTADRAYRGPDMSACAGTCSVTSNVAGLSAPAANGRGIWFSGHGYRYSMPGMTTTGREVFSHLGTAAMPMFAGGLSDYSNDIPQAWNMPSYTCTDCGAAMIDGSANWGGGGSHWTFADGGVYDQSPGEANFRVFVNSAASPRAIADAVYDKGYGQRVDTDGWSEGILGATFTNSYTATLGSSASTYPGAMTTTALLYSIPFVNQIEPQYVSAPLTHSFYYFVLPTNKPDGLDVTATTSANAVVSDFDIESPIDLAGISGKYLLVPQQSPGSPVTFTFTRINASPSKTDHQNMIPVDLFSGHYTNMSIYWEHITTFGGPMAPTPTSPGFSMMLTDEPNTPTLDAPIGGFRANLIWNKGTAGSPMMLTVATTQANAAVDLCGADGSHCDYNAQQAQVLSEVCAGCSTHVGNGYFSNFSSSSSIGGQHDLVVNPQLVDTTRRVATWYLDGAKKSVPATWTAGASVSRGDLRASSNAAYYSAKTIAYWARRAHTTSNPTRPDGNSLTTSDGADGSVASVVVGSAGEIVVTLSCSPCAPVVQLGDWAYFRGTVQSAAPPNVFRVNGVASDNTWFEATNIAGITSPIAAGTYTTGVIIDVWQNWWEPATLYQIRQDISAGTTYTSWAYDCNACAPAQAVQQWKAAGVRPTNEALRGYTYPGDTNPVTNPGAVQMAPLGMFPLPGGIRRW